ncbi:unnamed protein product [Spirodela intermedia]|uniref:Translation initiation factor eIF2B subunit gamma n=1 Tax=Spirodela intermedia TaxID=51605 RepID=A0ABN7ECQ2_SPIIN|nr:unnamed protein product [Spirodela intermedia]
MDFQVVVLAGGTSRDLAPLVSRELPKALLPVAERPVLSYVLDLLEDSNLKDIIVVVEEEDPEVTTRIGSWVSSAYADRLNVEVLLDCFDEQNFIENDILIFQLFLHDTWPV